MFETGQRKVVIFNFLKEMEYPKLGQMSPMNNYRIRTASPADLPAISFIENDSFHSPYPADLLGRLLRDNPKSFFVAEGSSGKLLGYCVSTLEGRLAHLISIAVLREYRRGGIATALLRSLIRYLKRSAVEGIWLEVKQANADAMSLYEKFGFAKIMVLENYYSDGSPAVRMRAKLNNDVVESVQDRR